MFFFLRQETLWSDIKSSIFLTKFTDWELSVLPRSVSVYKNVMNFCNSSLKGSFMHTPYIQSISYPFALCREHAGPSYSGPQEVIPQQTHGGLLMTGFASCEPRWKQTNARQNWTWRTMSTESNVGRTFKFDSVNICHFNLRVAICTCGIVPSWAIN